jgi:hypothetical protein
MKLLSRSLNRGGAGGNRGYEDKASAISTENIERGEMEDHLEGRQWLAVAGI